MTATTGTLGRNALKWKANSLAASDATYWARVPRDCRGLNVGVGWPATGTPIGVITVEVSNHGDDAKSGSTLTLTIPAVNGSAATFSLDFVTYADFVRLVYTRTSGGTGAAFTDDSGTAGTSPTIMFKG